MEAIDLNDDGQNDVMDEYIEDHEVIEISEVNRGTQPKQVQSHRDESVEKTEEEKEEEDKEKKKEEESGEFRDLTECVAIFFPSYRLKTSKEAGSWKLEQSES
ncbi:hypothetical protein F2Q70_00035852 [Brassica cretica]|uniref:Uncharacterized protein n=1 Tax=Brassica cretica TaxID=69181 RepID=A0A8S9JZ32_BRACR|nr:hypothetical protein F2Q68_00031072 [Brassica cretica]KAF2586787.1 hypothetical protein F2Q70_00035852 [Brassica cretica]